MAARPALNRLRRFGGDERGAAVLEYAIMAALIFAVVIVAIRSFATHSVEKLQVSADALNGAMK